VTALLFSVFHVPIHKILEQIKRTFRINTFLRVFQSDLIISSEALSRARLAIYIISVNFTVDSQLNSAINTGSHLALSIERKTPLARKIIAIPNRHYYLLY
jgi:hypothetical protein